MQARSESRRAVGKLNLPHFWGGRSLQKRLSICPRLGVESQEQSTSWQRCGPSREVLLQPNTYLI